MRKGFTTLQKLTISSITLGSFVALILVTTALGGTKIASTLRLSSGPGGLDYGLVGHWTFDGVDIVPAWSLNTAPVNTNLSKSVNAQNAAPSALFIKPDGTRLYVLGATTPVTVFQYSIATTTPWDVSSATYGSQSFSVDSEESVGRGIHFSSDGTKMYIVGTGADTVFQYDLGTAWEVSTAVYNSVNKPISEDATPKGLTFNTDGTKMYVTGNTNDTIFQYTLSTPWVVSSASYDSISKSVSAQDATPNEVVFREDGTRMFVLGGSADDIFQYDLSTPWNVGTASYTGLSADLSSYDATSEGLYIGKNGAYGYVTGESNDTVYQFSIPKLEPRDRSTNNFHSTTTGTVVTSGPIGQAYKLDGTDDDVQVSSFDGISGYPFTLSVWTRHTPGNNGSFRPALSVYLVANTSYHALGWNSSAQAMSASRNTGFDSFTGPTVAVNTWTHLVGVYMSATDRRLYVNGALSNTDTSSVTDFTPTSANMGGRSGGYCFCDVDDARIYNRTLSADEIKQLYQLGATTKVATTPTPSSAQGGLNNGLVGHWTFDGKDVPNGQVNDISGQANNGSQINTATSTVYVSGPIGQALKFDGSNDVVNLSVTSALDLDANYTLSAWVNPSYTTTGATKATIIKRGTNNNVDPGSQYQLRLDQNSAPPTLAFVTSDGTTAQTDTFGTVPTNTWSFVLCTHDGTTKTCYINAAVTGSPAADTVGDFTGTENSETIGCTNASCGAGQFFGSIDDVRVYNRVVSLDEIKQLYQLGATTKVATTPTPSSQQNSLNFGLQAHWTFDGKDMPNGQVNDVSGNSRNGSMQNMSTSTAYVGGPIGQGLQFDGTNDTIDFAGSTNLIRNVSVATLAGWVKPGPGANNPFIGITIGGGGQVNRATCRVDVSEGFIHASGRAPDSESTDNGSVSAAVQANVWQHIACIIDYANDLVTFYLNGVSVGTATLDFTNTVTNDTSPTNVRVGSAPNALNFYTGAVDDVRIYHRALTADEVKQLYQMGQ